MFAVRVSGEEEKAVLIAAEPEKFFTEPHYNGYPAVLVRLDAIDERRAHRAADGRLALRRSAPPRGRARRTRTDDRPITGRRSSTVAPMAVATRAPRAGSARTADAMLLTVVLLWSGNFTAMRYAVDSFHPLAFSSVRFAIGAALYALVVWWRERSLRIARRDLGAILLLAVVGIFINQVAVIYAVQKAGAANVGMLMASAPIIAALLARKLGHERIGARHVVGIAVAATGALLVLYGGGGVGGAPLIGWMLGLVTAATWATYSVLLRPLMARYSAERLSAAVLLTGSAMLIPVSLPQLADQDWGAPSGNAWLALGYSLVFSLLVTNVLWFDAIHRVGAARATVFLYLEPFCVALIAMAVLGEHVSAAEWVGGVVILGGVLLAARSRETAADR